MFRLGTLTSLLILFLCYSIHAAGKPIKVSAVSNLNFPTAPQGDGIFVVPAGTSETPTNASFLVTGDRNVTYTIVLPAMATMTAKIGSKQDTINLSGFTSFPSNVGVLNGAGSQYLYVGATRAAIRHNQLTGSYSGSFSVTVVY